MWFCFITGIAHIIWGIVLRFHGEDISIYGDDYYLAYKMTYLAGVILIGIGFVAMEIKGNKNKWH